MNLTLRYGALFVGDLEVYDTYSETSTDEGMVADIGPDETCSLTVTDATEIYNNQSNMFMIF